MLLDSLESPNGVVYTVGVAEGRPHGEESKQAKERRKYTVTRQFCFYRFLFSFFCLLLCVSFDFFVFCSDLYLHMYPYYESY